MKARSSFPLSRASVIGDDGKLVANIYNTEESEALRLARQFAASGDMLDVCMLVVSGGDPVLVTALAQATIDRCGDTSTGKLDKPEKLTPSFLTTGLTKSERTILEVLNGAEKIKTSDLIEITKLRGNAFYGAWRGIRNKRLARALGSRHERGCEYVITDEGRTALDGERESDRVRLLLGSAE